MSKAPDLTAEDRELQVRLAKLQDRNVHCAECDVYADRFQVTVYRAIRSDILIRFYSVCRSCFESLIKELEQLKHRTDQLGALKRKFTWEKANHYRLVYRRITAAKQQRGL